MMNMTTEWYNNPDKVMDLGEFLVQSEEISTTDELLEYFKHPERYTDVWNIYEKEILGVDHISPGLSKKVSSSKSGQSPITIELIKPCGCG